MVSGRFGGSSSYLSMAIETSGPQDLMLMLHQGGVKFLNLAEASLQAGDFAAVNEHLVRTQDIIDEIRCSLPEAEVGELASNLHSIYEYIARTTVTANTKKDTRGIAEAREMLSDLYSTWRQAAELDGRNTGAPGSFDVMG